jgi:hypothetical protein
MAKEIYAIDYVTTVDGTEIELSPLKIKYFKQFMNVFDEVKKAESEDEVFQIFTKCCVISMKQFYPKIKTVEDFEDNFDMKSMNKIIKVAGGIDIENNQQENKQVNPNEEEKSSWDTLDLVKLESEAFLLGIWKNFDELESSICIAELMAILEQKREFDYQDKKFTAAVAGVDLEGQEHKQEEDPWEAMKARVASKVSGIGNGDPNDITSLQGQKAAQAGFGIGMGLDYENLSQ